MDEEGVFLSGTICVYYFASYVSSKCYYWYTSVGCVIRMGVDEVDLGIGCL